jgi:hypothetical protein
MEQILCLKACSRPDGQQFPLLFKEFESSLPCSRQPTTGTYPETFKPVQTDFTVLHSRSCLEACCFMLPD